MTRTPPPPPPPPKQKRKEKKEILVVGQNEQHELHKSWDKLQKVLHGNMYCVLPSTEYTYPKSVKYFMFDLTGLIMTVGWLFCIGLASLPLFDISDYRKFAICLPFETSDRASLGKYNTNIIDALYLIINRTWL